MSTSVIPCLNVNFRKGRRMKQIEAVGVQQWCLSKTYQQLFQNIIAKFKDFHLTRYGTRK